MGDVISFPTTSLLERGDQIEIALRLIDEDVVGGVRPVTDEAGVYHVLDADRNLWVPVEPKLLECRVDGFAGCPVEGAKGEYPLRMKEGDAPAVSRVMRRHTWRPGFFRDDLIAFQNGIVVRVGDDTLVAEELTPEHGARVVLPLDYDDDWTMPDDALLAKYLLSTFPDIDEQARVLEMLGAALMGLGTIFKQAFFLVDGPEIDGRGGTGKSQLLEMLAGVVPEERRCSIPPQDFGDHYHGAMLYGKTLNVVFEAPDGDILREEGVKAIIHGETITRRPIRREPVTFRPMALHAFGGNRLPDAPGASGAFWDRWCVVEFNRRFRGTQDAVPELGKRILRDELHHLVHLALRGACHALERGGYTSSRLGDDALARWRRTADPVACFVAEWCVPLEDAVARNWTSATVLYDAYTQWCKARGHSPASATKFGRRIPVDIEKSRAGSASRYRLRVLDNTERARRDGDDEVWEF